MINLRHEKFLQEMKKHGNSTWAYQAAYPEITDNAARAAASRLAGRPEIKERLPVKEKVEEAPTIKQILNEIVKEIEMKRHQNMGRILMCG